MNYEQKLSGFVRNGSARQALLRKELGLDPYEATRKRVKEKLEKDVEYRTSILKGLKTLQSLSSEEMRQACESMEEQVSYGETMLHFLSIFMRIARKFTSIYIFSISEATLLMCLSRIMALTFDPLQPTTSCASLHVFRNGMTVKILSSKGKMATRFIY